MKKKIAAILFVLILFSVFPHVYSYAYGTAADSTVNLIVELDDGVIPEEEAQLTGGELLYIYRNIMNGFSVRVPVSQIENIKNLEGVKTVYQSLKYKAASSVNGEAVESGAAEAEKILSARSGLKTNLKGEGMVAAIIDNGFDCYHKLFVLTDPSQAALTKDKVTQLSKIKLNTANTLSRSDKSVYVNEKIPFAFDYSGYDFDLSYDNSHGTHVAGIIAANSAGDPESNFNGVAPEAQLLLMKVSKDKDNTLDDGAILAAFDDAITLGADVINMSFGEAVGFTNVMLAAVNYSVLFEKAYNLGIDVICAAGNESRLGEGSGYDKSLGISDPIASAPDYATLSSPASFNSTVAVASSDNFYRAVSSYISLPDGNVVVYNEDTNAGFTEKFNGKTYSYLCIPGYGAAGDYEGLDAVGKIALIKRGDITFSEKLKNAEKAGAIGVIVYNREGAADITMSVDKGLLPAAIISYESGQAMIKTAGESRGTVSVVKGKLKAVENKNGGLLSDFSSWGGTTDLHLKPDVTAPGGNIFSTGLNNTYLNMSGTSMAAPYISGEVLLIKQQYKKDHNGAAVKDQEYVRNLIMSSAVPIVKNGVEYSPRAQGAGEANISAALSCGTLLYNTSDGLCKIELGDNIDGRFKMSFIIKNLSDKEKTYSLSASAITDTYAYNGDAGVYFISGTSSSLKGAVISVLNSSANINRYAASAKTDSITVSAGTEAIITLSVQLNDSEINSLKKVYKNGFYIEGYIYAEESVSGGGKGDSVSIPYMGFDGDWDSIPVFGNDAEYFSSCPVSILEYDSESYVIALGYNCFSESDAYNPKLYSISPNGDGYFDTIGLSAKLLRNTKKMRITIRDAKGKIVKTEDDLAFLKKAYMSDSGDINIVYLYDIWDGMDINNASCALPDGQYYMDIEAASGDSGYQKITFAFTVDTVKPWISGYEIINEKGGGVSLKLKLKDDRYLQAVRLYGGDKTADGYCLDTLILFESDKASPDAEVVFDITGYEDREYLYVDIVDYAGNTVTCRIYLSRSYTGGNG